MKNELLKVKEFLGNNKEVLVCILIIVLAILGFVVRVNQVEEEKKSSYDSSWRNHHYSRSHSSGSSTNDNYVNQANSNNTNYNYSNSSANNKTVDDPYGKEFYDDADDFADDNAVEFGDGDEDDGWDDAYDYYEED